jgi:hypothetical protein
MIEFFKKNQDNLTKGAAVVLLLICYFQQRELAKLRKEVHVVKEIKVDTKTTDSLLKKAGVK